MLIIPDGGGASSGGARSIGPSPEVLGLATLLVAAVGLVSLRILTSRRRQPRPTQALARATAKVAPSASDWTNVRLDDNDALPSWLRAIAEPERAPRRTAPILAREPALPNELESEQARPARPAQTFAESLEPGAMRLAVAADETELLDQPADVGAVLTTLIAGDEVEIQDIEEPWVRVVTPLGSTGWLRTTSLGVGGAPRAPRPAT